MLSASIRGIGQDDFAFNIDPGVGVYLDGVFLARTFGANQNLLDVERVEILRGPQGTLFGRNTIGGAINIVTHDPGPEPSFEAQATVGSYDRTDVGFTADLPITDSLLSSLTVSSIDREGYQDVIPYPAGTLLGSTPFIVDPMNAYPRAGFATSDSKGGLNQTVVRGKLKWLASDDVKVTFAADYQNQDQPSTPTDHTVRQHTDSALLRRHLQRVHQHAGGRAQRGRRVSRPRHAIPASGASAARAHK